MSAHDEEEPGERVPRARAAPVFRLAGLARLWWRSIRSKGRGYPAFESYAGSQAVAFVRGRAGIAGTAVLDLGSGHGSYGEQLAAAGARVFSVDLEPHGGSRVVRGNALRLPFRDASFDGVMCSNVLEHAGEPKHLLSEMARVLRPSGWAYVSWTNWFSPWGGHEYSPWHYFGVWAAKGLGRFLRWGPRVNVPGESLFPVHVGQVLRLVRADRRFLVRFAGPRYWPSLTFIVRVPFLREVATWNCLLFLERSSST